jgi:3-oxoacyl-[acyl-carrier-protein] synthase II
MHGLLFPRDFFVILGDAYHLTSPSNDGRGAVRCMKSALRDASLRPDDICYINAHATSTPVGKIVRIFSGV